MELSQTYQYTPLHEKSENSCEPTTTPRKPIYVKWSLLCSTILTLISLYVLWLARRSANDVCGLPSDKLFGDIPWRAVVLDSDERFVESKPPKGNESSVWDDIYPGSWVAFDDPSIGGATGRGMQMTDVAADPSSFMATSEGFTVAVMHQIHCLMSIKGALLDFEAGGTVEEVAEDRFSTQPHLHHCIEIIRQAIMCQSDLSLEHTEGQTASGWGNAHFCRDFPSVIKAIRERAITNPGGGWRYKYSS
ncbi:hypothetical protein BP6252_06737 [Coleophoma cylindrospora]|uniref:Oxidase ustYa n=1 Tax=Coleophoma cylindrospora TaxID=1849047 RepID=A0A3D8RFU4_9HELO|nr:hypothetical protein BP6252_06737 [Coleophoma cylindrospora]